MKYKAIKSAAHNFGDSFASNLNYSKDDYVMGHLTRRALQTKERELVVDLLSGKAMPTRLLTLDVRSNLWTRVKWFPQLLESQNIDPARIRAAQMKITFDLERAARRKDFPNSIWVPFVLGVSITDDRGDIHLGEKRDEWPITLPVGHYRWWQFWK